MKNPKFRIGDPVKINNFFTRIKGLWVEENGEYNYFIETLNSDYSIQNEKNLEKPTDYELGTYY